MRRRTAALVLTGAALVLLDVHIDGETVDDRRLINIHGTRFDTRGWLLSRLEAVRRACNGLSAPSAESTEGRAVLGVVAKHSPPDSAHPRWHQALQSGDWLIVELSFERLSPVVAVLQRQGGAWRMHPTALWSGSTEPWFPATRIREHLWQQAPQAPQDLIGCFNPRQDFRSPTLLRVPGR